MLLIFAFFLKTNEFYNKKYNRYEIYSESMDISVYYAYLKEKDVLLITAFKGGLNE